MADLKLGGGPCWGIVSVNDSPPDPFTTDALEQAAFPASSHDEIQEVPCPDSNPGGPPGGPTGPGPAGSGFSGGEGPSTGPLPVGNSGGPSTTPNCNNAYGIQFDTTTCTGACCNRLGQALDLLQKTLKLNTTLLHLFQCYPAGLLSQIIRCLFNEGGCTSGQMSYNIKKISCDPKIIKCMQPVVAFYNPYPGIFQNNPDCLLEGNTIYIDCSEITSLGNNWRAIVQSYLFHEFVHVCEQCILNFTADDVNNGRNSELDAYLLQNCLFPGNSKVPSKNEQLFTDAKILSNFLRYGRSGDSSQPADNLIFGNFFVLDLKAHRFYIRTGNGLHYIECGGPEFDTPVFSKSTAKEVGFQPLIAPRGGQNNIMSQSLNTNFLNASTNATLSVHPNVTNEHGFVISMNPFSIVPLIVTHS
jgi:hypothetical protein